MEGPCSASAGDCIDARRRTRGRPRSAPRSAAHHRCPTWAASPLVGRAQSRGALTRPLPKARSTSGLSRMTLDGPIAVAQVVNMTDRSHCLQALSNPGLTVYSTSIPVFSNQRETIVI